MIPSDKNDLILCDCCGKLYPRHEMSKCKRCGVTACPKCKDTHKCIPKRVWRVRKPVEYKAFWIVASLIVCFMIVAVCLAL